MPNSVPRLGWRVWALAASAAGFLVWAVLRARASDSIFFVFGPFAVRSSGAGQLSSERYTFRVTTAGVLQVNYFAPRLHCSSVKIHFFVDGVEKALSTPVAPGTRSGYWDLGPVSTGTHEVALQAEGIQGGCNYGRLTSWQGSVQVWASVVPRGNTTVQGARSSPLCTHCAR